MFKPAAELACFLRPQARRYIFVSADLYAAEESCWGQYDCWRHYDNSKR
jgi:hypothetical protein